MAITDDVLNELLKEYQKPEDLLGKDGILKQLQKRLLEKALGAELTVHLGYGKHEAAGRNSGNSRNGTSPKTMKGEFGDLELATPRDRNGTFEPQIIAKGQRRFEGFDQAIISLYSRGLTTREIEGTFAGDLRSGGVAGPGFASDRGGQCRRCGVAEPALGGGVPDRVF